MKRCLSCGTSYASDDWNCRQCGYRPARVGDVLAFAPQLAGESSGFRPEHFSELARVEDGSFWFNARNRLIVRAMQRYAPDAKRMLEIGCGTGFVLRQISRSFPNCRLSGTEVLAAGLAYAGARVPGAELFQMDARAIPYEDEFDVVGAFDVLEHIEEDETVIAEVHRSLRAGGRFIITVPQHRWLWSRQDEYACHVRRYTLKELSERLARCGFRLSYTTSFVSLLLPILYASRLRKRADGEFDATDEMRISPLANRLLGWVMAAEFAMIAGGVRFPAGGSLLAVATKE